MILQIAVGIVLAVIILELLPAIISLTGYAVLLIFFMIIVGLAVSGLTYIIVGLGQEMQHFFIIVVTPVLTSLFALIFFLDPI